jgi:hypothetical protein
VFDEVVRLGHGLTDKGRLRQIVQAFKTAALQQLGLLNILWHGGSGDTVPEKKRDFGFLVSNLRYHSRRGGILLIHDQMRHDALRAALARMAADPEIRVVPLLDAVERKFACTAGELSAALPSFT